ncbi:MAG: ribosome biogenesis GTP-binding protein YihA/YsxC [Candidatus Cloacimonetes bacterium]|nr:ribosome biogenesis GTP-binding protein YihA/YsxC [Candidatus Cloacimonadota bacterium]
MKSAVEPADYPASAYPEFAFAGRSNVGKSTLINLLTGHHGLAKTSNHPGKTRLLNFFLTRYKVDDTDIQGFIQLTDLPGYGFAEVSLNEQEKWRKMISKYFEQRTQLRSIVVLVDIRHPADRKDIQMLEMLRLRGVDHCIVATKADKIPKTKIHKTVHALAKELGLKDEPVFAVSALLNTGFQPLLDWIYSKLA